MGEWKKLVTASDDIGTLNNVSSSAPSANDTLKWDGSNWVPGEYNANVQVFLNQIIIGWHPSNTNESKSTAGQVQLSGSNSLGLTSGSSSTEYIQAFSGNMWTHFYAQFKIANAASIDSYAHTKFEEASDLDNALSEITSGTATEVNSNTYQLTYEKLNNSLAYPTFPANDQDDGSAHVKWTGQIGSDNAFTFNFYIRSCNRPYCNLMTESLLSSITDTEIRSGFAGALNQYTETYRTTPFSYTMFTSQNSGWIERTLTDNPTYFWVFVPKRMVYDGGSATYVPLVSTKVPGQEASVDMLDMGTQSNFSSASSNGIQEDFQAFRSQGAFDNTSGNSTRDFKIEWQAA